MSADTPHGSRPPHDHPPGPVVRKDADGQRSIGTTWESVTERIIREAQERGEFDNLPAHGRPLPVDENPYAGDMALAFHVLRNAGVAPPWIETDKEARRLRDAYDALLRRAWLAPLPIRATLRREVEQVVADHDSTVRRLDSEAPSVRNHRRPIGRERALAALDAAIRGERPAAGPSEEAARADPAGPDRA
jgi:hypothetical protein